MSWFHLLCISIAAFSSERSCAAWRFYSPSPSSSSASGKPRGGDNYMAEFSMNSVGDERGLAKLQNAKNKLLESDSCWQNAYAQLLAGCSEILADHEMRSRFAWHLSDCFQRDSGRARLPHCDKKSAMTGCLQKLDENEHKVFLEFSLETNSICYQLQSHVFKSKIERLVNDLKDSARFTDDKLNEMQEKTNSLLVNSNQIQESLGFIDEKVHSVVRRTTEMNDDLGDLQKQAREIHKESIGIGESQVLMKEEQAMMSKNMMESVKMLQDSYISLGEEVESLKVEALEIENQIGKFGETMSLSMENLQTTSFNPKRWRKAEKQSRGW